MKPLEGITVIELSTMITASLAAMIMAEQGARVIKVEPIDEGDPMRYLGSSKGGIGALFANCNRGKQSIRVDLKNEAGKAIVRDLAKTADVLLCNFRPGVMDSLELGSESLRALNARLVYTAVSGFGTVGPERDTPAYDPVIQAQAGFTAVQGQSGPEFVRNLTCDKVTAYTACQAVTAALYVREKTGEGQHIDLSMMDAGLYFLFPDGFMHHTLLDDDVIHTPPLSQLIYDLTQTSDGGVTISASTDAQRVGLLLAIDQVALMADERFNSQEKLLINLEEFRALLADEFLKLTTDELLAKLRENDVPAAKCLSYEEVLDHPQYSATQTMDTVVHPVMGKMRRVKPPVQFGGQRLTPASDSPAHGEHTEAVLRQLGMSDEKITDLIAQGVVAAG
jgi:crotonobetainyl-CoA:carnitine CoA-transferase CaiB-like acyl-CoA transferase